MMILPPAHTLGAALAQSVSGALLTILAICAPLLAVWALCHWLERLMPPADPDPTDGPLAGLTARPVSTPSGRIIFHRPPVGRQQAAPTLMTPLTLTDLDLAAVATLPVLPSIQPATPATPPAAPPVSSSVGSSLGVLDRERGGEDGWCEGVRKRRPHGYILTPDGRLVRLATLRLETAYPLERCHWN